MRAPGRIHHPSGAAPLGEPGPLLVLYRVATQQQLEGELQCHLSDPRIGGRLKRSKAAQIVESGKVVHRAFVAQEVDVVKDVEEFGAKLQLHAFSDREILRESHVPGIEAGETHAPFTGVTEGVGWIGRERSRIQPVPAGQRCAGPRASAGTIRASSYHRPVLSDTRPGVI